MGQNSIMKVRFIGNQSINGWFNFSTAIRGKAKHWSNANSKQHYMVIGIFCDLASPAVSECNTTVATTNPRSLRTDFKQTS